jgi:hypothetical protein
MAAGASPVTVLLIVSLPQVTVRATVSAESSSTTMSRPPGLESTSVPRIPGTLPALPTLMVGEEPNITRVTVLPLGVFRTLAAPARDGLPG